MLIDFVYSAILLNIDGSKISDPVQLKEEHGAHFQEIFDTKSVLRRGISPEIINLGLSLVKETCLVLGEHKALGFDDYSFFPSFEEIVKHY